MKKKPFAMLSTLAMFAAIVAPASSAQAATTQGEANSIQATLTSTATASVTATPTVPVILFPGIGGSQLYGTQNDYNTDNGIVWVDKLSDRFSTDLLINDADLIYNLALKHATTGGVTNVVPVNSDVSIWSPTTTYGLDSIRYLDANDVFLTSYLDKMIDKLKEAGYVEGKTLFGFPQDWRQDYAKHFSAITSKINQALAASGASKVALVAHSQGGMLVKSYLLANPAMEAKIDRVITLGTPYLGAAEAVKATSPKLGGYNFGIPLIKNTTGYELAKHAPAVYNLAPAQAYENYMFSRYGRATINSYVSPSNVPTTATAGVALRRTFQYDKDLFDYAKTQHSTWDTVAPSVKSYHLISDGVGTEVAYNYTYCSTCSNPNQVEYVLKAGDGTVPLISAEQPGSTAGTKYFVHTGSNGNAVSHMDMVKDANVLTKVLNILQGSPSTAVTGINSTPNRGLDAASFTAYSFTGEASTFDADVTVTDVKTGKAKKLKIKNGKIDDTNAFADNGIIIRSGELENNQFNVQLIAQSDQQINIEVSSNKNTDLDVSSYEMDSKGVTKRESFGKLKQQAKSQLKIEHGQGKHKIAKDGKALQSIKY